MKIDFLPSNQQVSDNVSIPEPAKNLLPEWYKRSAVKPLPLNVDEADSLPKGLKSCTPFLDALTSGYIQKTWCDIIIDFTDEVFTYRCGDNPLIMESRKSVNLPISERFYPIEFAWLMPWIPKTPKGYSVMCTHPHNRIDLPFTTLTGIIDSDEFNHVGFGKFPFYIERGFKGIIPAGTPIIQFTPFKRDDWDSTAQPYQHETQMKKEYSYFREYFSIYRNKFWKKKNYR
jgi:hypothetical protein